MEPVGQNVDGDVIHNGCHVWAAEQLAKETRKTETMGKEEDALSGSEPRSPCVRKEREELKRPELRAPHERLLTSATNTRAVT